MTVKVRLVLGISTTEVQIELSFESNAEVRSPQNGTTLHQVPFLRDRSAEAWLKYGDTEPSRIGQLSERN